MKANKYTIKDFNQQFPTDDACLEFLFKARYPKGVYCEKCGQDGLILEAIEAWGKSEESMAKYLKMPVWSVHKRAKQALSYVASGPARRWHHTPKRKGEDYQAFKKRKILSKNSRFEGKNY